MEEKTFEELGLSAQLLSALEKKGFEKPSQIQAEIIPILLEKDQDIVGQAQTGTGKTAAFGLPIIEKLEPSASHIQALVLTPTRELTIQVSNELHSLKGNKEIRITPVYGGQSIEKQRQQLKRKNAIIVGTPGRLIDHLKSGKLDLSQLRYVVLDEADEMLTSGFIEDIEWILSKTNPERTTLLFSATMPAEIMKLAEQYMQDYVTIKTKHKTLATSLTEQIYFEVRESDKLEALCRIIDVEDDFYGFIFCRTKRDVDTITERLINRGYDAEAMHGDLSQFQRERVLGKFRKKHCSILVVTDVASRGLDVSGLSHVINFALPQDPESYVHRVGRTGRAGQSGTAITFITPSEYRKLTYIQKIAKTDIKKADIPSVERIMSTKKNRLKNSIQESIEVNYIEGDYLEFAEELLANYDPKAALASVLKVAFESEFSEESYSEIKDPKSSRRDRERGRDRGDRRGGREGRRSRGNDSSFVDGKGQTRLFIAKGKLDQMNPKELVAYIEKKSRVHGKRIQGVEIYDKFSFVNVSFKDAESILKAFQPKDGKRRSIVERAK